MTFVVPRQADERAAGDAFAPRMPVGVDGLVYCGDYNTEQWPEAVWVQAVWPFR